jgi:hypothetical protein
VVTESVKICWTTDNSSSYAYFLVLFINIFASQKVIAVWRYVAELIALLAALARSHFEDERVFVAESVFYVENVCFLFWPDLHFTTTNVLIFLVRSFFFFFFLFLLRWLLAYSQRQRSMLKDIGKNPSPTSDR